MADKKYPKGPSKQDEGFKGFLYNPSTGAFMGRTGSSWAKIIIFYLVFFAGLAAFFCLNYYIFYLTLNMDRPKYLMEDSLIGANPGLGFRPMPDRDRNADSTLIWFTRQNPNDQVFWSKQLEKFVDEANTASSSGGSVYLQSCTLTNGKRANEHSACKVDVEGFEACNAKNAFGYWKGEPCILIKLNKIYGWEPKPYGYDEMYDRFSIAQLDADLDHEVATKFMPESLKWHIRNESLKHSDEAQRRMVLSTVWINCDGENVADIENVGAMQYYPMRGIAGYYFPYLKQRGYQSPFIFVQLTNPQPGVVINIECKAFAKNVKPDRLTRLATTHFELLME